MGENSPFRQAVQTKAGAISVSDPASSATRCKMPSSIRDMTDRGTDGRDTFRNRPASVSDGRGAGENANPNSMVRGTGY